MEQTPSAFCREQAISVSLFNSNKPSCCYFEDNGYEYLIKQFADDSGHTAQEFYTNRTLVHLPDALRHDFGKRIGTLTWQRIADEWLALRNLPELSDLGSPMN
jgi:hypothetical protein